MTFSWGQFLYTPAPVFPTQNIYCVLDQLKTAQRRFGYYFSSWKIGILCSFMIPVDVGPRVPAGHLVTGI